MRIAIFGAGGIGGYLGGRLSQAGEEVVLIARGEHLKAIREHGLRVDSIKVISSRPRPWPLTPQLRLGQSMR